MIVVRDGVDKWACFLCPGGCGEVLKLSLSRNRRPRWKVNIDWLARPTAAPSVRQLNECRCHFWIRKGRVEWCRDSGRKAQPMKRSHSHSLQLVVATAQLKGIPSRSTSDT
ncbi:DUF6527 family protein [Defluviimonas salinarum]|uniref:DUF6527 family protein n=1 Tax=Defluviimonas salinarum TaxID=2992147 RepID=A0ABT3J6E1_9RHOB|nr:DUF6527 family protein [Defluviimonas salinarum]MCW3783225.1 DUF6527 family protein [Defluviimonas salinarum]